LYIYPNPKEELDEELERQRKEVGVGMSLQFHGSSVTASVTAFTIIIEFNFSAHHLISAAVVCGSQLVGKI